MGSKLMTAAEAVALVADGDHVAIQSMGTQATPMTLVRELIRQGRRELTVTCVVGGIGVDWLAWKGCMSCFCGPIVFEEYSETGILVRLAAGARGLPFQITRGMIGTDLPALLPDAVREIEDPFSGERVLACRALRPDVCLLHAHRADAKGNVQYRGGTIWPDVQSFPKAAARTIVSVEEVVSEAEVRRRPHETVIPHFAVDAVVEARHGCHPTSFFPDYTYDQAFHREWVAACREPERALATIDSHCAAATQAEYLELIGAAVARTRDWAEQA